MSKGTVRIKPKVTRSHHMGQVILTEVDQNQWRLAPGSPLSFDDNPPLIVNVGDIVECNITSQTECTVTKIVGTATMAQGKVTSLPTADAPLGWLKVTEVGNPNPCNVIKDSDLHFTAPEIAIAKDDIVECLPFTAEGCDVTNVLIQA